MNILFFSDIHFGREKYVDGNFENRLTIQDRMIETIASLPEAMKPNYIIVTGDIAWTGIDSEYNDALIWFQRLLERLSLDGTCVSFCAGNHDVNRKYNVKIPLDTIKTEEGFLLDRIDELYQFDNVSQFEIQLISFNCFCDQLGVIPYKYKTSGVAHGKRASDKFSFSDWRYSYTFGSKHFSFGQEKYEITAFNTALLSGYRELPDDEMFIGLPQVETLVQHHSEKKNEEFAIALFHHAERFLNTNEMNSYSERPATLHRLLDTVDLALCGHTETGSQPLVRQQGRGRLLNGGAAYYSDDHPNTFSILHLEPDTNTLECCTFVYKGGNWHPFNDLSNYDWRIQAADSRVVNTLDAQSNGDEWKVVIDGGDKEKIIPIKVRDFGLFVSQNESHICFTNFRDVNRLIDVYGDENGLEFRPAPGRNRYVDSVLEQLSIVAFIEEAYGRHGKCTYRVVKPDGNTFYEVVPPKLQLNQDEKKILALTYRLQRVEEHFHIKFSLPEEITPQDQTMLQGIENIIEDGGTLIETYDVLNSLVLRCNSKELIERIMRAYDIGKPICFQFVVPIIVLLFGTEIKLGECELLFPNLRAQNRKEIGNQIDSFMFGDIRRVQLTWLAREVRQLGIIQKRPSECYSEVIASAKNQLENETEIIAIAPQLFETENIRIDKIEAQRKHIAIGNDLSFTWSPRAAFLRNKAEVERRKKKA